MNYKSMERDVLETHAQAYADALHQLRNKIQELLIRINKLEKKSD